jgi:hypothetical protein
MDSMQKRLTHKMEKIANELEYEMTSSYDYSNTGTFYISDSMLIVYFTVSFNFQAGYATFEVYNAKESKVLDKYVKYTEVPDFLADYSKILHDHATN